MPDFTGPVPEVSGYFVVGVSDLAASRRFWVDGLGLAVAGEWEGQLVVETDGGCSTRLRFQLREARR